MSKYIPQVGEKLFLSQRTGNEYVDLVKRPYTVVEVKGNAVVVQECKLIFNGPRYYDTIADDIQEDLTGEKLTLHWSQKKEKWQIDKYKTGYPEYAFFGKWEHFPYLD